MTRPLRVTSRTTSTRSPRSTSAPTRARTTSRSCTCRPSPSTTSSCAARRKTLLQYAHTKRVFPVSPTTFTSQLQVIVLGLKGMQIEQRAHEVMAYVAQLEKDFGRFRDDFDVIGKHLGHAQSKYSDAERRLDRFETKLERAAESEVAAVEPQTLHSFLAQPTRPGVPRRR